MCNNCRYLKYSNGTPLTPPKGIHEFTISITTDRIY